MRKTKIAFFGTQGWQITNRHLERFIAGNANIVVFVKNSSDDFKSTIQKETTGENIEQIAKKLNIPVLSPLDIKSKKFQEELASYKPDAIIVCGYQYYIPKEIRDIAPIGTINFHSSLLPRHCGMHPGFWTIWYGDKISGMTLHFMDDGIDTGDIIYFSKVPVKTGDTVESLYKRIWNSSIPLVDKLLDDLDKGSLPRKKQDYSKYTYNYEICDKDFELDFRQPAEVLAGRVMMFRGKFYFILNNSRYYVNECKIINEPSKTRKYKINTPYLIDGQVAFATPRQYFVINKIQKDGKDINPLDLVEIIK